MKNNTSEIYHTDHLGSSTYLTDNFGRPSHYYETLPFGEMMVEHNQSASVPSGIGYDNKYKFNGKELDDATGMYYYGARYYDPRISIFVSVDPLAEQTMTPYQYVHNNPIMFTDPTGMEAEGIIIGKKNTTEQKQEILSNLQKLTDDKLSLNSNTGEVTIARKNSGTKKSGTGSIRDLISHEKDVTINYGPKNQPGSFEEPSLGEEKNAYNGVGANSIVTLGVSPKVLVADKNGKTIVENMPDEIALGHELAHSLPTMDGYSSPREKQYTHSFTNRYGQREQERRPIEEFYATGLSGYNRPSNKKRSSYPTENSLRRERGMKIRISYGNGKL